MPIFKLFAPETVSLLSGHILLRSESNFTHNHLDFKKTPEQKPMTLAYRGREEKGMGWKGIKGYIPLQEVQRERTGVIGMGRQGLRQGGSCSKVLRGDRCPCMSGSGTVVFERS